jgi:hypothetical protein
MNANQTGKTEWILDMLRVFNIMVLIVVFGTMTLNDLTRGEAAVEPMSGFVYGTSQEHVKY